MVGVGITLTVLPFYNKNASQAQGISSQNLWLHVGLITGVYPFMQFLFSPYPGSLSERYGRRRPHRDKVGLKAGDNVFLQTSLVALFQASNSAIQMR